MQNVRAQPPRAHPPNGKDARQVAATDSLGAGHSSRSVGAPLLPHFCLMKRSYSACDPIQIQRTPRSSLGASIPIAR